MISKWWNPKLRRVMRTGGRTVAASAFLVSVAVAPLSGSWLSGSEDNSSIPSRAQNTAAAPHSVGPFPQPSQQPAPAGPDGATTPSPEAGVPSSLAQAYVHAEQEQATNQPSCNVKWWLLAAIGRVESNHARGGQVDASGNTLTPILGPQLNGENGLAAIADTDGGAMDGDTTWDRAMGAMQFIPSTWQSVGVDGNKDGQASPHNVFDAALSAGKYLCADGRDLNDANQLVAAIYSYNPSYEYVQSVLAWARVYSAGASVIPNASGASAPSFAPGTQVPGNPGTVPTLGGRPAQPAGGQPAAWPSSASPGGQPGSQPMTPGGQQPYQPPASGGQPPASSGQPPTSAPPGGQQPSQPITQSVPIQPNPSSPLPPDPKLPKECNDLLLLGIDVSKLSLDTPEECNEYLVKLGPIEVGGDGGLLGGGLLPGLL